MAYSVHTFVGDGVTTQYAMNFTLGYLTKDHVFFYVEGEVDGVGDPIPRALTWITDSLVDIGAAPAVGLQLTLRRETPKDLLMHDFQDKAVMSEKSFDESHLQAIMLSHELLDGFGLDDAARQFDMDMFGYLIKNLGDPVDPQDAVTKIYVDAVLPALEAAAAASAAAALVSENNASTSESNASTSESNASTSESNASTSESNSASSASASSVSATESELRAWEAEAEKLTADSYATEPLDTFVKVYTSNADGTFSVTNTTEYSALHYAAKSEVDSTDRILSVGAAVSSSSLNLTLDPITLDFRSTTQNSGVISTVPSSLPVVLTISSGSTLGTIDTIKSNIVIVAINNAGTIELACINLSGSINLDETTLIDTVAEGGGGGADLDNVFYSTTSRTGVAFRVVGFVESTQAVAGTWSAAPSLVQGVGGQAFASVGSVGFGQTRQPVTRLSGVTYYNTTRKPIILNLSCVVSANVIGSAVININNEGSFTFLRTGGATLGSGTAAGSVLIGVSASYVITHSNISSVVYNELS